MGVVLTVGCYLVAFSPSLALFVRLVAPDPLKIILFILGAFLWLVSLLVSSLLWVLISLFWNNIPFAVGTSILLQESMRVLYFWMLKKAQRGLNKMTQPGSVSVAPGVSDLHNARHMLAIVCGLGMGVMAALFLTMNVFAEFSGSGSVGLPEALKTLSPDVNSAGQLLPLYYALSACILTLLHVTWTIMVWDSCHHCGNGSAMGFVPAAVALSSHYLVSGMSVFNSSGHQPLVLLGQFVCLLISIVYCHYIMGGTIGTMGKGALSAIIDWFTLSWLRSKLTGKQAAYMVEEMEAEPRNVVQT